MALYLPSSSRLVDQHATKFTGHTYNVTSIAFSPDGTRLASSSYDRTVKLWDIQTGNEIATFKGHLSAVSSVAFSQDGNLLASGSWDKTIRVWNADAQSKDPIAVLQGHIAAVESVAFSYDGTRVASGSDDHTIRVWDHISKECTSTLKGHTAPVKSIVFSPNRKYLASGSSDYSIRFWNLASQAPTPTIANHTKTINSIAFSPNGTEIASGSDDATIRISNAETGEEKSVLEGHDGAVYSVAFSLDGKYLVSGSVDRTVRVWAIASGVSICIEGHGRGVLAVGFSPDGRHFVSGAADKTIRKWSILGEGEHPIEWTNLEAETAVMNTQSSARAFFPSGGLEDPFANMTLTNDVTSSILSMSKDRIGSGGFGDIFLGKHKDGSKVALKRPRDVLDKNTIKRFLREIEIWCKVTHIFVLPCIGTCKVGREVYVVSPYAKKGDLSKCIQQGNAPDRRKILYEMAQALSHLHGKGIVHGDVKAENVLVSDNGSALLTDFGLAKILETMNTSTSSKGFGTTRWMAPELHQDHGSRTYKSDVYSFGITIAEVLSGRAPFSGIPQSRIVEYVVYEHGRPAKDPASDQNGRSYAKLWEVAEKCWATDEKDRPSMPEVCRMLSALA